MHKMSQNGLFFLFICVFICLDCFAGSDSLGWLVSTELLKEAKLNIVWQNQLPVGENETLDKLVLLDRRLYAISDKNYLVSLSKKAGDVIFSSSLTQTRLPVIGLDSYKGNVFSVIANRLVEINPEFGTETSSTAVSFNVSCPAVRNESFYYIGGVDRRVHVLGAKNKVQIFTVSARSDSIITSIAADETKAVFATDKGNVISIRSDAPKKLWQFDAAGAIAGKIIKDANSLFFASRDTNVYRINWQTGKFEWKYQTSAILDRNPVVTAKFVYQYVDGTGLVALDKDTGKFMWRLANGNDLLADSEDKAYVITTDGTLVVMDSAKGRELYSVNLAGVSKYAANTKDSRIFIANDKGKIACLQPVD